MRINCSVQNISWWV